jgi:hypothetical protein
MAAQQKASSCLTKVEEVCVWTTWKINPTTDSGLGLETV